MADNTFQCSECGQSMSRAGALTGAYVQCPHCGSLVSVPKPASRTQPDAQEKGAPAGGAMRPVPLWVYFGCGLLLCVIAMALIYWQIRSNSREQAAFQNTIQAAENAETPDAGLQLIEQLLRQSHLDSGQKAQARTLRTLLKKQVQVNAAMVAVKQEEAVRLAAATAAAAKQLAHATPAPPPEPTLADAQCLYDKGVRLAHAEGVEKNEIAAFGMISNAAAIGLSAACHDMAAFHAEGIGCVSNLAMAVAWGRKAARQGDAEAQSWLGYLLLPGVCSLPADPVQAAQWNGKAAAQGEVPAMLNLGLQYVKGVGVPLDLPQAFSQFSAAAARGNTDALTMLGMMYWKGLGVAQDPTNAASCFKKAHEMGNTQSTFALGLLYGSGYGVGKDRQMAAACFLAAARNGHVGAQKQIGRMYFMGSGVSWSEQDAIFWFRKAAAQGDAYAIQVVDVYRNTHLPPVFASCTACAAKGRVERTCAMCGGAGVASRTMTGKSIRNCTCGWQMVNGRCPNCGRTENVSRTITEPCTVCNKTGHLNVSCNRCGGSGQVRVAGPAQESIAQMLSRPDPGIGLDFSGSYTPVRLLPFRTGVKRAGGI